MNPDQAITELATKRGGFVLWVGAGASIALTGGATPGWPRLVKDIRQARGLDPTAANTRAAAKKKPAKAIVPLQHPPDDMPDHLELLASKIGHAAFRKELRQRLLDPVLRNQFDRAVYLDQSAIGTRASAIVSFNIEYFTAFPFCAGIGGTPSIRTFRERPAGSLSGVSVNTKAGTVGRPMYFPHGLLDYGNLVMTRSEYDEHRMSLAVATAVQICLGGDLVIMGMSLGDSYLRAALLQHRRSIDHIFWIDQQFEFEEWARVARVTCIPIPYGEVWSKLASAFVTHDHDGNIAKHVSRIAKLFDAGSLSKWAAGNLAHEQALVAAAQDLVAEPRQTPENLRYLAKIMVDAGYDVPGCLANDPRLVG